MALATIEEAIEDLKNGKFLIIVDDANRENEGDLVVAGDHATPKAGPGLKTAPVPGAGNRWLSLARPERLRLCAGCLEPAQS